ncbi:hypothetical protein ID855_21000 [Xenorhabdus sp. ZM]|uniref:hypothetical protein n=1 Tax=Xenorhabdus szentirmaii TaxID=290112 RepID=UPI0019ADABBA|nr:hypothetical protein [Xenorhabdus sp. ZM]MBD2807089.1 hypothetical protein [Xenorhabdus sp. ZM]
MIESGTERGACIAVLSTSRAPAKTQHNFRSATHYLTHHGTVNLNRHAETGF